MYVKWTSDLQEKGNKGHSSCAVYFFCAIANMLRGLLGFGGGGVYAELSPVGLKESYLLLLPITSQSPALSTCKMTLDMPVLTVFYR